MFGAETFERPVVRRRRPAARWPRARPRSRSSSSSKLGAPFFTFHDRDVAPEGDDAGGDQRPRSTASSTGSRRTWQRTGVQLLWGTANLFSHRRYAAGAATNPDPEVFAYAAAQVKKAMEVDAPPRRRQLRAVGRARGLRHAAQHRPAPRARTSSAASCSWSSSTSTRSASPARCSSSRSRWSRPSTSTTTTPPPCTPSCCEFGLEREIKLNIEANHATLAGHSFQHELAYAIANDLFGSVDVNRGDPQNGWDTDQFPNSADEIDAGAVHDPAGRRLHHRRLQLRRQAAPPEHRARRSVPRPHRRHGHAGARPAARRAR